MRMYVCTSKCMFVLCVILYVLYVRGGVWLCMWFSLYAFNITTAMLSKISKNIYIYIYNIYI